MIKAILFDLDGVIVDSEPIHRNTFIKLLAPLGIDIKTIDKETWAVRYTGTGSLYIMTDLFKRNKIKEDPKKWVEKRTENYNKLIARIKVRHQKGFIRFFNMISKQGLKKAVVTGGHRSNAIATLKKVGMDKAFDDIITIENVKHRKPYPDAYLLAVKRLGLKKEECIAIEDSPQGVKSAKRAGLFCVALLTTTQKKNISSADLIVKDFTDKRLKKLLTKK
jgi:HAD superfamily hydrolase (TIGR01509 family)